MNHFLIDSVAVKKTFQKKWKVSFDFNIGSGWQRGKIIVPEPILPRGASMSTFSETAYSKILACIAEYVTEYATQNFTESEFSVLNKLLSLEESAEYRKILLRFEKEK